MSQKGIISAYGGRPELAGTHNHKTRRPTGESVLPLSNTQGASGIPPASLPTDQEPQSP